jgi:hypothetical protein
MRPETEGGVDMGTGVRCAVLAVLLVLASCAESVSMGENKGPAVKPGQAAGNGVKKQALDAVQKVLKGERLSDLDLKNLDDAVIQLETGSPDVDLKKGKGVEERPEEKPGMRRNVYILRFDAGGGGDRQLQMLRIQREILKNQLILLKSLGALAGHQVLLNTRTARVENTLRDMTLGMKASGREMAKVMGETASTNAKTTDIASTTTDMAKTMEAMAKNVEEIESAMKDVDLEIGRMSKEMGGTFYDIEHSMERAQVDAEGG